MEGYEIYRLSEEEIQHVGVKGMKWGKRKSRSAYMTAVDKHEAKTSARRDAKKAASKAKYEQEKAEFVTAKNAVKQAGKNYIEKNKAKESARLEKRSEDKAKFKNDVKTTVKKMRDASEMIEAESQAKRDAKKAASKAKYEQEKADFANAKKAVKQAGKNYIERNKAKESARLEKRVETKAKFKADTKTTINKFRDAAAMMEEEKQTKREVKGAARKQLAKARAKDLSDKLSKGLNIAVAVNDVYGDISPTGLKNHFANAEQLEKYGIEYNP